MELARTDDTTSDMDFASVPVPRNLRMKKGPLTMAWWALCSGMAWLMIPVILARQLGSANVLIGLVLATIAFWLVNRIIVRFSARTGLSVSQFSRIIFGQLGGELATLIFFATAIFYAAFEGSVIAVALNYRYPSISLNTAYLLIVAYSVPLVFGSIQKWLDKLNGILLPFFLAGLAAAVVLTIKEYGAGDDWLTTSPPGGAPADGWWKCFVYFMGVSVMMMYTWDYARFGKVEDSTYHENINFGFVFYAFTLIVNGCVGLFLMARLPLAGGVNAESAVIALVELMGLAGLIFVAVTQTRINTSSYYLASVNMKSFSVIMFDKDLPKWFWAVVAGVIVYLIMLTNIFSIIIPALAYQGTFTVAWVAIALTHILSVPAQNANPNDMLTALRQAPAVNKASLLTWAVASTVGLSLLYAGPGLASFSSPITAALAVILYRKFCVKPKSEQATHLAD